MHKWCTSLTISDAGLHDLLVKIDTCGYFDKEIEEEEIVSNYVLCSIYQ